MKRNACIVLTILFAAVAALNAAPDAGNGDVTVMVEGIGVSRDDALLAAKRNAVEQGVGIVLIAETEVKNFALKKDVILTRTVGSVKRYDVLKETSLQDGSVYIKMRAVVSLAAIKADLAALKILLESMDKPRVMVLIEEPGEKTAENSIIAYLRHKGFDLVDAAAVAARLSKGDDFVRRAAQGDAAAAARIGAENGAEYVITGTVAKSTKENSLLSDAGMISGQAAISAKAVNCSNARIAATNAATGAAYHVSDKVAMAQAAEKAAVNLMENGMFETIVATFQDMINNGILLTVTIEQVPDFGTQKAVRQALESLPGTVAVSRKAFGGGRLLLSIQFKGTADTFSEAADGKTVSGRRLSVTEIAAGRVGMILN